MTLISIKGSRVGSGRRFILRRPYQNRFLETERKPSIAGFVRRDGKAQRAKPCRLRHGVQSGLFAPTPRGVSKIGLRRQRIVEAIEILIGGSALLAVLYGACVYIGVCIKAIEVA